MSLRATSCLLIACCLAGCTGRSTPATPVLACGNGALNGLEPCDGEVFRQARACAAYGLGDGDAACTSGCMVSLAACAVADYCEANGLYGDGRCDACDLLGGHADPDCAAACGADGVCADRLDPLADVWTCQHAGLTDPDCGTCGNGVLEGNELCDGDAFSSRSTCGQWGYGGGHLGCTSDCRPDFGACTLCGNGVRDPGEACDGPDLGGWTCKSFGLELSGTVACTASCRVDASDCRHQDTVDWSVLAGAYCSYIARCAGSTGDGLVETDEVGCERYLTESFACTGLLRPDAAVVDQCVAELGSAGCGPYALSRGARACLRLSSGESVGGLGAACQTDAGCGDGLYCDEGGGCGVCRERPRTGELCSSARCVEGDYCSYIGTLPVTWPSSTMWVCAPLKAVGQGCVSPMECDSGWCTGGVCGGGLPMGSPCNWSNSCDGLLSTCDSGVCTARRLPGAYCSSEDDCQAPADCVDNRCAFPDRCSVGAVGEPCGVRGCQAGAVCSRWGVCEVEVPVGSTCSSSFDCGQTAYCDGVTATSRGQCMAYRRLGSGCAADGECAFPARCDSVMRVCAARRAIGADCTSAYECESYSCIDGICADQWACGAP